VQPQRDADQRDQRGRLDERTDDSGKCLTEVIPHAPMLTAIASSKLLPAAVKPTVVVFS
jgi:hypothetical protein